LIQTRIRSAEAQDSQDTYSLLDDLLKAADSAADMCARVHRVGSNHTEIKMEDLQSIVESAVSMAQFRVKATTCEERRSILIVNNVSKPLYVNAIYSEVHMAVLNILLNAIRHCGNDSEDGLITITSDKVGDRAILAIENNGSQVPESIRGTLLKEPLSSSCVNGIGLYSAASNLRAFGGEITFRSEELSTVFLISLELYRSPWRRDIAPA
jgi:signal transduction histidine kinase